MKSLKFSNDCEIPILGLGTWLSEPGQVYQIVKSAIELGYRHIDCAAIYGNEIEVGQALKEVFSEKIVCREELFITSKLWNSAHAEDCVIPALKKTLADLGLSYLDLYLIHWPVAFKAGVEYPESVKDYISLSEIPIIETYAAMEKTVSEGLTKSIGVSNFSAKKLADLVSKASIAPAINQVELHPYLQQVELLEYCTQTNIKLTAYCPLGSSGRPSSMLNGDENWVLEDPVILQMADLYKKSPAQIVLNWGTTRGTAVIPKTVNPKRALENFQSQDFVLTDEAMKQIAKLDKNYRYLNGEFFSPQGSTYTLENLWD